MTAQASTTMIFGTPKFDELPDRPISFGWKIYWLAIPSEDARSVADAYCRVDPKFRDTKPVVANWSSGFGRVIESGMRRELFISPAMDGWVLAINFRATGDDDGELFASILEPLSEEFGLAYAFGSHRVVSLVAWAKAQDGKLVRAFAEVDGDTVCDIGERLPAEEELNTISCAQLQEHEHDDEDWDRLADEETVTTLAARWTIDTTALGDRQTPGTGFWLKPKSGWF